jgi:hypothetical protein
MILSRDHLVPLLNALHRTGTTRIPVSHPSDAIGDLLTIELGEPEASTVEFGFDLAAHTDARQTVHRDHGQDAFDDLPDAQTFVRALTGSGLVPAANADELTDYVSGHGHRDLENGHAPLVLGIDTNLMAWELPRTLGIDHRTGEQDAAGRPPTNGYALATGVKEELDWHYNHYDTYSLERAFGPAFERLSNQPAGENREGFLGLYAYRNLRSTRNVDFIRTETGDESIIDGYVEFGAESRKDPLVLSNDCGFIEHALDRGLLAHHVAFAPVVPRRTTASWRTICNALYVLTVLFGVLVLPKVTLYGVWNGKTGTHWQHGQLVVDCRSPKIEPLLERQAAVIKAYE